MRALAFAFLAAAAVGSAVTCPAVTGPAFAQAEYRGMSPKYGTPPRPDYFNEPNYRPPGKEPNRYDFVIGVDADTYRRDDTRPRPPRPGQRPDQRPPYYGPDRPTR